MTATLALLRATRPRQWIKNLLVAAAPVAAGEISDPSVLGRTVAAVAVFTAASGAVYLLNDSLDVEEDRTHPLKATRPIAAGDLPVAVALTSAATLTAVSLSTSLLLDSAFTLVLVAYFVVNVAYSLHLKHIPWIELALVASGFVLRAVGGGAATDLDLSVWFVAVVCGGSLFVVTGKRTAELLRAAEGSGRVSLGGYTARSLRALRALTAAASLVAYSMWIARTSERTGWLALLSLLFLAGAFARYDQVVEAGRGEHPEDVFLGDRAFQLLAAMWAVFYSGAVYG